MISPSTTTITSESSETTSVTSRSGLTSVGVGGVVFKPPGYVPPLTSPEQQVTVSIPTSPVAPAFTDFNSSALSVLNEKVNKTIYSYFSFQIFYLSCMLIQVKQLETTVHVQTVLIDKLSTKLEFETEKRNEMEKEFKKIMELVTRV